MRTFFWGESPIDISRSRSGRPAIDGRCVVSMAAATANEMMCVWWSVTCWLISVAHSLLHPQFEKFPRSLDKKKRKEMESIYHPSSATFSCPTSTFHGVVAQGFFSCCLFNTNILNDINFQECIFVCTQNINSMQNAVDEWAVYGSDGRGVSDLNSSGDRLLACRGGSDGQRAPIHPCLAAGSLWLLRGTVLRFWLWLWARCWFT